MYTGSLPPASIYGTWMENLEVTSADDGELVDLSSILEITLQLIDQRNKFVEMTVRKSEGQVTVPSTGIIQWRVEQGAMYTLTPKLYEVVLTLTDVDQTIIVLVLGTISIVE